MRLLLLALLVGNGRACKYGALPWYWVRHAWENRAGRAGKLEYHRLDDTPESLWMGGSNDSGGHPFGEAWHVLDPECQTRNYVTPVLAAQHIPQNITVLFLGDSLDAQMLDYVCEEFSRSSKDWFAYVHSHRIVNYCSMRVGNARLNLVQVYLVRLSLDDDMARLRDVRDALSGDDSHAALRFDGFYPANLDGRADEVALLAQRKPDLVVMSGVYWPLQWYSGKHKDESPEYLLPASQVDDFVSTTTKLVHEARLMFHGARLVVRTSPEIRTDCAYGSNIDGATSGTRRNKRTWGRRTYVDALNNAIRWVAQSTHAELFDAHHMAAAFTPSQVTVDDLHPRAWFQFELLNLYLNRVLHGIA